MNRNQASSAAGATQTRISRATGARNMRTTSPACGTTARIRHTVGSSTFANHGSAAALASPRVRMSTCPSRCCTSITRWVSTGRPGSGAWKLTTCPTRSADTGSATSTTIDPAGAVRPMLPVSIVTVR